ncbi:MAG: multicopper oxidase family protein [Pseudomonadota bacterium]
MQRRTFASGALIAPVGLVGLASFGASPVRGQASETSSGPWAMGAHPDFTLDVRADKVELFGKSIDALLVGQTWPGTPIRYRKGERFRVLVNNHLAEPTSIHWHGLILPNLEDGVPSVTQSPILPSTSLYYEFELKQAGTFWYHSHFGLQEQQGLLGALIIDDPDEPNDYDEDVTIVLGDVTDIPVDDVIGKLRGGSLQADPHEPYTMPDGSAFPIDVPYLGYLLNGKTPETPWTQALRAGRRARLRFINASGSTFFRVAIDGLSMMVVACDGDAVEPVEADDVIIGTAQRYDVLVTLPESGSYTIHAAALGDDKQAIGVLHTKDTTPNANTGRPKLDGRSLDVATLQATEPTELPAGPVTRHTVELTGEMKKYLWAMNGNVWPEPYAKFADDQAAESYYDVAFGQNVRFDFVNHTMMAHPMHLHGHVFRVIGNGDTKADAPLRDTVVVYPKQKISIEFVANNPGKWFFHCHNIWHLATGMAQAVRYEV